MKKVTKDDFLKYEKLQNEIADIRNKLAERIKEIHNIYYYIYSRNNINIVNLLFGMCVCDIEIINSEYISYALEEWDYRNQFYDKYTNTRQIPISLIESDDETIKKYFEELLTKELDVIEKRKEEEENNKRNKKLEMYKKLKKEFGDE